MNDKEKKPDTYFYYPAFINWQSRKWLLFCKCSESNRVSCNNHRRSTYPLLYGSVSRKKNVTVFWHFFFNKLHFFSKSFLYYYRMAIF